jgi:opacity protein-like surface antigen
MADCKLIQAENSWLKPLLQFIIMCFLLSVVAFKSYAQDGIKSNNFMWGVSFGYGAIKYDKKIHPSENPLTIGFQAGYSISPHITAGLDLNYLQIKADNGHWDDSSSAEWYDYIFFDPDGEDYYLFHDYHEATKGENIINASLSLNVYPFQNYPFYITGGGGIGFYEKIIGDKHLNDNGWTYFWGCGYEFRVSKGCTIGPQFKYSKGSFSRGNYNVAEISIAFNF